MFTPWSHQIRAVDETLAAIAAGQRRIALTVPTGGGKTWVMFELARRYLEDRKRVVLYTNRRPLLEQLSRKMGAAGLDHGTRASGEEDMREKPFQISSIQTEHSMVNRRKAWNLHDAHLVLVDEAHDQAAETAATILNTHHAAGAAIVGPTATPFGLAALYDHLIVAANVSDLRACGAIVPAIHYGPDEPDWKEFKGMSPDFFQLPTEPQAAKAMDPRRPEMFGSVWHHFKKLNPDCKPTLLFGPDVEGSLFYAEQFSAKGVPAAHIDGDDIWIDGKLYAASPSAREDVFGASEDGRIRVLCNRYVCRTGIDAPWLCHGIFATVFGSLGGYLQSGGRLLRAHLGIETVSIQDHGGNWWRHGSLNEDRLWNIEDTANVASGVRADRMRAKRQREPFRCPGCGLIWVSRKICSCGYELAGMKKSRPVLCSNGTLRQVGGDIFRPRSITRRADGPSIWERFYWAARKVKTGRTFSAAAVLFARNHNWQWPSPDWPLMPKIDRDWHRHVSDVPFDRLTSVPERWRDGRPRTSRAGAGDEDGTESLFPAEQHNSSDI
jgi:DNA repair protein RadD